MESGDFEMLLNFFKALGNESRLKIIGLLANGERTVGELATALDVREPTVSQHLNMLKEAGLVNVRPDGNHRYYSFNTQTLLNMNKGFFSREGMAALAGQVEEGSDEWERKIFKSYMNGDVIKQIPTSDKKLHVILKWLADRFEYDVQYPEKQVNEVLKRHHPDCASLRRSLVDYGYMQREKNIYWRVQHETTPTS
jgi:hypothetical protein